MKVLITGGDGFIGSHNAEYILEKYPDSEVVLVDNLSRARGRNYKYLREKYGARVSLVEVDMRNCKGIEPHFKGIDRVYHAAAQVAMTKSLEDPMHDYEVNSTGTMNVLEAIRKNCSDAPVLYCSTNKVYGNLINLEKKAESVVLKPLNDPSDYFEEDTRYKFKNEELLLNGISEKDFYVGPESVNCPYSSSKLAGEIWMKDYYETYGLKTIRVRMSCIYGPRQYGTEDQGWVAWLVKRTLLEKPITIFGSGKQVRDLLFCQDQTKAFDLLANNRKAFGDVFNLGGGTKFSKSLIEVLDIIEFLTKKRSEVIFSGWRHGDQKIYVNNIDKITKLTNFSPKTDPYLGIEKLIDWFHLQVLI